MSLSQNLPVYPPWHAQPMYINLLSVLAVSPSSGSTHWPPCWQVHILMVGLQLTLAPLSSVATKVTLNYKGRKTSYVDSAPLSICQGYFFRANWTVILQRKCLTKRFSIEKITFCDDVTGQWNDNMFPVWFHVAPAGLFITWKVMEPSSSAVTFSSTVSPSVAYIKFEAFTILGGKLSVNIPKKWNMLRLRYKWLFFEF